MNSETRQRRRGLTTRAVNAFMADKKGVPERLEFSVIGPAANEVARLESLSKTLGRRTLVSAEFARHLPQRLESLGKHALRGVGAPVEVLAGNDS